MTCEQTLFSLASKVVVDQCSKLMFSGWLKAFLHASLKFVLSSIFWFWLNAQV